MLRPRNLPLPPFLLRALLGFAITAPLHASEPVWSTLPVWGWLGEGFYAQKRQVRLLAVCVVGA